MTSNLTRAMARWIAELSFDDLPPRTRDVIGAALLDTLGAGLYGATTPWARTVRDWAEREQPKAPAASVWGAATPSLKAVDAALVNGVAAHAFELDDYHNAKIHPGAPVIPAALAMAEAIDASGRALVTALAAGYEVMIRTALAVDPVAGRMRGWHLTGITGPFGAAAACASLLGLDAGRTAWALGLAGTQGAGLFAFNADGAMSKRLHPGRAAHAGVLAAELAHAGFTGPTQIYEADDGGFLKAHSDSPHPERLLDGLGHRFHLDATSFKSYSCCGSLHSYVDAALELRAKLGPPRDPSVPVRVGLSRVVDVQCGFAYEPSTVMHAQMSLRYAVAVALVEGAVLPREFAPEKLHDPVITGLTERIELVPDPALDRLYPEHFAGWVSIGAERVDILDPTGSAERPMDRAALGRKFRGLLDGLVPPATITRIDATVSGLAETSARALIGAMAWA